MRGALHAAVDWTNSDVGEDATEKIYGEGVNDDAAPGSECEEENTDAE